MNYNEIKEYISLCEKQRIEPSLDGLSKYNDAIKLHKKDVITKYENSKRNL